MKGSIILLMLSMGFTSYVVLKYYNKNKKKKKPDINEVIIFSHDVLVNKKSKYSRCVISKSMDRLLYYLSSPRYSIDICMYVMTNFELTNAILKLGYRGIKIRVIMDADMAFSNGSAFKKLEKQKIPIRWKKSTNLMHHKFCLIDTMEGCESVPLVIMGSLNWTNQALSCNWEDAVVTSQPDIVGAYKAEFERLWIEFKPIVP